MGKLTVETASNVQRTVANLGAQRQALAQGTPETATENGLIVQTEQYLNTQDEYKAACDKAREEMSADD